MPGGDLGEPIGDCARTPTQRSEAVGTAPPERSQCLAACGRGGGAPGETGEPSSRTVGRRHNSAAAIMYDWPVIHPGVAITRKTSRDGSMSKTTCVVRLSPTS